jgi:alkanesulfonate monooxygenase SsuD/methylene tetrahydromethanopterin reductase-like flavin-dependent oxidoreductase (luciferase family)
VEVGVGLPNAVPGTEGRVIVEWARRADRGPFASVGLLDRVRYDSMDPFPVLGAAAAVTERVRLVTMVVIAPIRSAAVLAKQAASVDALSGGRLTLGLAIGARHEDYRAVGVDPRGRGRRFSDQLAEIRDAWEARSLGPSVGADGRGPELLVGGWTGTSMARVARFADGYVHGGGPPRAFERAASQALAAWADLGRPGRPSLYGQAYFALGDAAATERGADYLRDYYAFTGPFAEKVAAGNLTSARAIRDFLRGYEDAGCDHLVLLPTVSDPAQVDRLADVLG